MNNSHNVVNVSNSINDDLFLCRAFAKAIESDKLNRIVHKQTVSMESSIVELNASSNDNAPMVVNSTSSDVNIQWKVGDQCLCPYSEDGLLYKATIIDISSSMKTCTISFDDYGNMEIHELADLQIRTDEDEIKEDGQHLQQDLLSTDKKDLLAQPSDLPSCSILNSNVDNDSLSSTLMSWYLAGYHTGFYQGIKDKKNVQK